MSQNTQIGRRLSVLTDAFRAQLWPIPGLAIVVAIALGVSLPLLDGQIDDDLPGGVRAYLFSGGAGAAAEQVGPHSSRQVVVDLPVEQGQRDSQSDRDDDGQARNRPQLGAERIGEHRQSSADLGVLAHPDLRLVDAARHSMSSATRRPGVGASCGTIVGMPGTSLGVLAGLSGTACMTGTLWFERRLR